MRKALGQDESDGRSEFGVLDAIGMRAGELSGEPIDQNLETGDLVYNEEGSAQAGYYYKIAIVAARREISTARISARAARAFPQVPCGTRRLLRQRAAILPAAALAGLCGGETAKRRDFALEFSDLLLGFGVDTSAAGHGRAVPCLRAIGKRRSPLDDRLWQSVPDQAGFLIVLFALAARNRFRLTQRAERGDPTAIGWLRRSILIETALILAIFGVAALWRFTPPPRALAEAAARPAAIHIHSAKAMADLTITPGRTGPVTASMIIMTGDYGALAAKEVTLSLANPVAGIEPIRRSATRPGDGTWQVTGLSIPVAGRWSVRIDILLSEFELARLEGEIDIRP